MKKEFTDNQEQQLLKHLHKAVGTWLKETQTDTKRVEFNFSLNQTKLNSEISCYFIIKPKQYETI